jgi:hypothetical protein
MARHTIPHAVCELLKTVDFGTSDVAVRINPLMTDLAHEDLKALLSLDNAHRPDTIVVPKVDSAKQMMWLFEKVESICRKQPEPEKHIKVLVQIESTCCPHPVSQPAFLNFTFTVNSASQQAIPLQRMLQLLMQTAVWPIHMPSFLAHT